MPAGTVGVKLDADTRRRLAAIAEAQDRTPHWVMKTALAEYLDREERRVRECAEDAERWERFSETGEFVPQVRVEAWLEAMAEGGDERCPR